MLQTNVIQKFQKFQFWPEEGSPIVECAIRMYRLRPRLDKVVSSLNCWCLGFIGSARKEALNGSFLHHYHYHLQIPLTLTTSFMFVRSWILCHGLPEPACAQPVGFYVLQSRIKCWQHKILWYWRTCRIIKSFSCKYYFTLKYWLFQI